MIGCSLFVVLSIFGIVVGVDRTLSPNADGRVVVEAVVDRIRSNCIFGDDRLFLRRLAYVETSDGEDSKTYRPDYDGGIWQIDEEKFNLIPNCTSYRIREQCNLVRSSFNIDWSSVVWSDLRKPLYSGLAAALYIQSISSTTPSTINSQASFWISHMRSGGQVTEYVTKSNNLPGNDCETELDLAFIIDGSGSVSPVDFQRMLRFIQDVVRELNVNEDEVHVAALEYSTRTGQAIKFNDFTTKSSLVNSIGNIRKGGSGTSTHLAIQNATYFLFNQSTGARPSAKRVAILLTDGASNDRNATLFAAAAAKARGITMFSVGVGNINQGELEGVATAPNCTHVFILNNFLEIDSLLYELKDRSCSAGTSLTQDGSGRDSDANTVITKTIPENKTITEIYVAPPPTGSGSSGSSENSGSDNSTTTDETDGQDRVVKSEVQCGSLEIYASYDTPRPGPAFYDIRDSAQPGRPSLIYLNTTVNDRSLYITVIGSRLPETIADVTSCLDPSYTIAIVSVPKKATVVCRLGEIERTCTEEDFRNSQYSDLLCEDAWSNINNPCTAGSVTMHAHPFNLTKFIRCDMTGKMYVTQCPNNETFNENTKSCSHQALDGNNGDPLPANITSQCTAANLARRKFHFTYPADKTKYIQCDVWGRAWVKPCPSNLEWNDISSTCAHPAVTYDAVEDSTTTQSTTATDTNNPCTSLNSGSVHPHSSPNKFITCSHGRPVVSTCPGTLVYDTEIGVCNWPKA